MECLLQFDDRFMDIRQKRFSLNSSRVRNARSNLRNSVLGKWIRPKLEERRELERANIRANVRGGADLIGVYDLLCERK